MVDFRLNPSKPRKGGSCDALQPDVAPAVLSFNYEARNAQAYKFSNSATSADPCIHRWRCVLEVCGNTISIPIPSDSHWPIPIPVY